MIQSEAKPKKCKNFEHCGNMFTPNRSTDRHCSYGCAMATKPRAERRKINYEISKSRKKEPSRRTRMKLQAKQRDHYMCMLRTVVKHECDDRREAHHILYLSQGGPDELWNLITLCGYAHHEIAHRHKSIQAKLLSIVNGQDWLPVIDTSALSSTVVLRLNYLAGNGNEIPSETGLILI